MPPKFTKEQTKKLNLDKEFQSRVSSDEELNRLFSERDIERPEAEAEILSVLGGLPVFNGIQMRRITPALICVLGGLLANPLIPGIDGKLTYLDADVAAYLMASPDAPLLGAGSSEDIKNAAAGFCDRSGIDRAEFAEWFRKNLRVAFSYAAYIPETMRRGKFKCLYDADWLAWLVAQVSQAVNLAPDQIKNEITMTEAGFFILQHLRLSGYKGIERKTRAAKCLERLEEMMRQRLKEMEDKKDG